MSDRDNEPIDPPDNQGGGNLTDSSSTESADAAPIDPPDNQGGGSGG